MHFLTGSKGAEGVMVGVSTGKGDKRREPRHGTNNPIRFSQLNKNENYVGLVRDYSRSGMFFFSARKLNPGTCIVIHPLDCHDTDVLWGHSQCGAVAVRVCSIEGSPGRQSQPFINMVTAQVVRCEPLKDSDDFRYGVAVDYIRPTI